MIQKVSALDQSSPPLWDHGVRYLAPIIVRRTLKWPFQCEAEVHTPLVKQWRTRHEVGMRCVQRAKVDFHGKNLCYQHAKIAALIELAGPEPVITLSAPAGEPRG